MGVEVHTTGFSDFFTIAEELSSNENILSDAELSGPEQIEGAAGTLIAENKEAPGWIIPVTVAIAAAAAAVIAVLTVKKKG